jgi:CubicO group peptidase (beta-lactamase class C family)
LALLVTLLISPSLVAQEGAARTVLDTWVESLNTLQGDDLDRYIEGAFSEAFFVAVPLDQVKSLHRQLQGVGEFEVGPVEADDGNSLVAYLRSGDKWFRAQLAVDGEPARIQGFLVQPSAAPGTDRALEWNTLDELAEGLVAEFGLPGVAIAWARSGEEPQVGVAGVRAMGAAAAVSPDDRFHIGSITKSVTSTALGRLVESDDLRWQDTLVELLPELAVGTAYESVTLDRLVRHRGGIQQHQTFDQPEMARLNGLAGTPTEQRRTYVAEVLELEPLDGNFAYSNAGYAMAGYIGEVASGRSWEQLLQEEVFDPLGLASCGIGWPATHDRPDEPRGHFGSGNARTVQGLDQYELGAFMGPAGNVHCSVADLTRYGLAHLKGLRGENGFLTAATVAELHRASDDSPYAAGWGVDPVSGQHRHNGSAGTFFSYLVLDPTAGVVVAFLTNAGPPDGQSAGTKGVSAILDRVAAQ